MTYEEALRWLDEQRYSKVFLGLDTIRRLMELLGNPQKKMKYVHIAGTNGKGSTAACMDSILRRAGLKTGLMTSPYLVNFEEKIRVDGEGIDRESLIALTEKTAACVEKVREEGMDPTPFEIQTAVAFQYFLQEKCQIVVLEVGLGGRLDSTNVIDQSEVSLITSLSMEHQNFLGDTIEKIAGEKAGIIKEGGTVICHPQCPEAMAVIRDTCRERKARLLVADPEKIRQTRADFEGQNFEIEGRGNYRLGLAGDYQTMNAAAVVMAADILAEKGFNISEQAIREGLASVRWPGRFELVHRNPRILVDGAHNPGGVKALGRSLEKLCPEGGITFVAGVLADKEYLTMIRTVEPLAKRFITVTPDNARALPAAALAECLQKDGYEAVSVNSLEEAADMCLTMPEEEIICVFGSLYYVGKMREYLTRKRKGD